MKQFFIRILLTDCKRAFLSWRFALSILLGGLVCYFTLLFCGPYRRDTLYDFMLLHDRSQVFLAYIVGILSYSLCFYDDFEYGNIKNVVSRIKIREYVTAKTIAALASSMSAFVLGKFLFIAIYSLNHPFVLPDTLTTSSASVRLYYNLLLQQHYILYFVLTCLQKSFFIGVLCQIVMLVSVVIPNKAVVFSIPIAVFYILSFYINAKMGMTDALDLSRIFDGYSRIWENDMANFLYSLCIGMVAYIFLYYLTLRVIRKRVSSE